MRDVFEMYVIFQALIGGMLVFVLLLAAPWLGVAWLFGWL